MPLTGVCTRTGQSARPAEGSISPSSLGRACGTSGTRVPLPALPEDIHGHTDLRQRDLCTQSRCVWVWGHLSNVGYASLGISVTNSGGRAPRNACPDFSTETRPRPCPCALPNPGTATDLVPCFPVPKKLPSIAYAELDPTEIEYNYLISGSNIW